MHNFTPVSALIGGALIGMSASLLLLGNGRIAGVSGILGGLLTPKRTDVLWRVLFLLGLVFAGVAARTLAPLNLATHIAASPRSLPTLAVAGLLVGFGTRLGGGCTSGHGVCGISRLSPRSVVATVTFMLVAMLTVRVVSSLTGAP
jgi:uncharacterized membrane protein YedE/YeeE